METGTWSALGKVLLNSVIGWAPGWFLRRRYPIPRLRERVRIAAVGIGPYINVVPGSRLSVHWDGLTIFNQLPFPIELQGLNVEVDIDGASLAKWPELTRQVIGGGEISRISLDHDLTDSQAARVSRHSICPKLAIRGTANFETAFLAFAQPFHVETLAFVYRGPSAEASSPA